MIIAAVTVAITLFVIALKLNPQKEIQPSQKEIRLVVLPFENEADLIAQALDARYIFTERVAGEMTLRRGFDVKEGEKILICEDIITTGGSAMEAAGYDLTGWNFNGTLADPDVGAGVTVPAGYDRVFDILLTPPREPSPVEAASWGRIKNLYQ